MSSKNLVMLAIMDGYGIRNEEKGNAIANAKKPNLDKLFNEYPNTTILASGEAVGLPDGQMGNSEVGHMNIGAGRVVFQSLTRVNIAVREDSLMDMPVMKRAVNHALDNNSDLQVTKITFTVNFDLSGFKPSDFESYFETSDMVEVVDDAIYILDENGHVLHNLGRYSEEEL